jgi:hypothetical protein
MRSVVSSTPRVAAMAICLIAAVAVVAACSPALDWREVRSEGGALTVWLPCKPQRRVREVDLAGTRVSMEMLGCRADGSTWGLTSADVGEVGRVEPALAALRKARTENLGAPETAASAIELPTGAGRLPALALRIAGRDAAGDAAVERSLIFSSGTRVFHVAVIGREPSAEALDSFFRPLRLAR